jgi:hypothetical protein
MPRRLLFGEIIFPPDVSYQQTATDRFLTTPEILLTIINDYVHDIETLLCIRHTCGNFLRITTAYERSISQTLAKKLFPQQKHLVEQTVENQYTITWLIHLVPRQLAAILVDRHRAVLDPHMYGIPAEDPAGDPLRARVANGFCILHRLSSISQHVHKIELATHLALGGSDPAPIRRRSSLGSKISSFITPADVALAKKRETLILDRRLELVRTLSERDREDYQILSIFLIGCFEHLWSPPATMRETVPDGPFDWGMPPRRWMGRKDSWVNWFILHHGPKLFWEQWWSEPCIPPYRHPNQTNGAIASGGMPWHYIGHPAFAGRPTLFEKMQRSWNQRSKDVIRIERDYATRIEKELLKGLDYKSYNPPRELLPYQGAWEMDAKAVWTPEDRLGCVSWRITDALPDPNLLAWGSGTGSGPGDEVHGDCRDLRAGEECRVLSKGLGDRERMMS